MTRSLQGLIRRYGTERILARVMEQLRLLAGSPDSDVRQAVAEVAQDYPCDVEYLHALCEYNARVTYVSDQQTLSDEPWQDRDIKQALERLGRSRGKD